MPTVNVYFIKQEKASELEKLIPKLKIYLADRLTCGDIKLTKGEISVRLIPVVGKGMIGDVELEITAHAFPERVKKQDEICRDMMNYIKKEAPSLGNVKVWLKLCELGHSW